MEYLFGGIALASEFELDQLEPLGGRVPHVRLALTAGNTPLPEDDIVHRSEGRYRLTLGRVAGGEATGDEAKGGDGPRWIFRSRFPDVFVFDPARQRIDCHIRSTDDQAWQDVLFRRVVPRIATTYGATAIHAAAVAIDDRCLLLLGRSGAGKSTLTAFCAQAGWRVMSDDITLLWDDDGVPMVEPVQRGMGVWDATREALELAEADCTPMPGYEGRKWCFRPPVVASPDARPLSGVLVLERSDAVAVPDLAPLAHDAALRTLLAQNIPFMPDATPDAASATAFGRIAALARRVPCLRLRYPDGYALLPRTERSMRTMTIDGRMA